MVVCGDSSRQRGSPVSSQASTAAPSTIATTTTDSPPETTETTPLPFDSAATIPDLVDQLQPSVVSVVLEGGEGSGGGHVTLL